MPSKETPDIYSIRNSGDVRELFRQLRHSDSAIRCDAAQALGTMSLNSRDTKKAHKEITNILKKDEGKHGLFKPDPISFAKYKHALILLDKPEQGIALMSLYKIWFKAYSELLIQHKRQHGGSFKLGVDSDRARMARVEQVANQVIKLCSDVAKNATSGLVFVIITVGQIEILVSIEGIKWLTIEEHEGHHDWSRSRKVFKTMCTLLTDFTHLKYGFDHERWGKLGNNLVALMLSGDVDTLNNLTAGSKLWSAISNRTDLQAPNPDIYRTLLES